MDGLPVEIQVRTHLQHEWAQFYEKLADELGRGIRYGEAPGTLDEILSDPRFDERRESLRQSIMKIVDIALGLAELIEEAETTSVGGGIEETPDQVDALMSATTESVRAALDALRTVLAS